MGAVLQFATALITEECAACSIAFAIPQSLERERRRDLKSFYCPNGHILSYRKSTEQELREQLAVKDREIEAERRRQELLKTELRGARIAEGKAKTALSRAKQRARGGMCPCCKRSFTDMGRHMATKHPDFGKVEP